MFVTLEQLENVAFDLPETLIPCSKSWMDEKMDFTCTSSFVSVVCWLCWCGSRCSGEQSGCENCTHLLSLPLSFVPWWVSLFVPWWVVSWLSGKEMVLTISFGRCLSMKGGQQLVNLYPSPFRWNSVCLWFQKAFSHSCSHENAQRRSLSKLSLDSLVCIRHNQWRYDKRLYLTGTFCGWCLSGNWCGHVSGLFCCCFRCCCRSFRCC